MAVEHTIGDLAALQNLGDGVTDQFADPLEAVRGAAALKRSGALNSPGAQRAKNSGRRDAERERTRIAP